MTKTDKKSETSVSTWNRAQPFGNNQKEWPNDDNKIKVMLANPTGGATFDEYIRVIDSSEHPELFLLWLQDFNRRIREHPI